MRKIKFTLRIKDIGSFYEYSELMEYDDDTKDKEIQQDFDAWKLEQIEGDWIPVMDNDN